MTRERWFCCLCGALVSKDPGDKRYVLCRAHDSVTVDFVPPDPYSLLPMSADELSVEDTAPTAGTERC